MQWAISCVSRSADAKTYAVVSIKNTQFNGIYDEKRRKKWTKSMGSVALALQGELVPWL